MHKAGNNMFTKYSNKLPYQTKSFAALSILDKSRKDLFKLSYEDLTKLVLSSYGDSIELQFKRLDDQHILWLLSIITMENAKKTLRLFNNQIGNVGAKRLSELLKNVTNIHSVNLDNNHIGVEGVKCLMEAAEINVQLIEINLSGNGLKESVLLPLKRRLRINSQIQEELKKTLLYIKIANTTSEFLKDNFDLTKIILDYYSSASSKTVQKYLRRELYPDIKTLNNRAATFEHTEGKINVIGEVNNSSITFQFSLQKANHENVELNFSEEQTNILNDGEDPCKNLLNSNNNIDDGLQRSPSYTKCCFKNCIIQ